MSVAIMDFGAQYAKVIDRRVRELNIYSEIIDPKSSLDKLKEYDAIILSGGPNSVYKNKIKYNKNLFKLKKPILGICYGMQLINFHFKGKVNSSNVKEYGETIISTQPCKLFKNLDENQEVLMSHGDSISKLGTGFEAIAKSNDIIAGIANEKNKIYGLQFHPEVDLTKNGKKMLENFLFEISDLKSNYTLTNRISSTLNEIKTIVKDNKILVLVSGGVDSAVTAALLIRALNEDQVYALHIDHGFMRKNESKSVCVALKDIGLKNLVHVNAKDKFFDELHKVTDPEKKRQKIGDLFMKIVDEEVEKLNLPINTFIAQGTLRPDLIESASSLVTTKANKIKTHHNDSKLVREKRKLGLVLETNKDLHKDEVRKVGQLLGLPEYIVNRHPFPGPGLAIRIICADKPYDKNYDKISKQIENIVKPYNLKSKLIPVRSVGVQGDHRSYSYVVGIIGKGHYPNLRELALKIPKKVHEVNRVIYFFEENSLDFKFHKTELNNENVNQLQEADFIVRQKFKKHNLMHKISQAVIVSLPIGISGKTIVIRPFVTNDFMTGRPANWGEEVTIKCLKEIVKELKNLKGISNVAYDLTSKPPGTTEWE